MKILITGAGGYLGTVLVRRLLATTDWDLVVLDRFSWGTQPPASVLTPATASRVSIMAVDLPLAAPLSLGGIDAVIHLAGIVGYPACDADPTDAARSNVHATHQLCRAATEGCPLVFASTGSCYGKVTGLATEATPLSPLTSYGRQKAEAERFVRAAGGVCLRLATLYGCSPRMRWDLLPHDFARRAAHDRTLDLYEPEARRTFLHVEDAASAFQHALTLPSGVYNVGDETQNYTKREVAELVSAETGCTITAGEGADADGRDYAVSFEKIRATGWHPSAETTLPKTLPTIVELARIWR